MISPQGFECKVLRPYLSLAAKDTFIPYIFMEWMHVKNNLDNNCPDLAGLIAMFVENGYTPWNVNRKTELDAASEIQGCQRNLTISHNIEYCKNDREISLTPLVRK